MILLSNHFGIGVSDNLASTDFILAFYLQRKGAFEASTVEKQFVRVGKEQESLSPIISSRFQPKWPMLKSSHDHEM